LLNHTAVVVAIATVAMAIVVRLQCDVIGDTTADVVVVVVVVCLL